MRAGVARTGWTGVLVALSLSAAAHAADVPARGAPGELAAVPVNKAQPVTSFARHYVGGALNWAHHTGYVPNTSWDVEHYTFGAKVFGGYRINDHVAVEIAYHYLGRAPFDEGFAVPSYERSHALSGSVVIVSPWVSSWAPIHVFVRLGLAYKDITHEAVVETFHEGTLAGVLGAGLEYRLPSNLFVRFEYEFISTAIGGSVQTVPTLGLFPVNVGGTRRVINVMHTPLALTLGANF